MRLLVRHRYRLLLVIATALVLWRMFFWSSPVQLQPLPARQQVIDVHCHIACLDTQSGCYISPALRHNARFPVYMKLMQVSDEELAGGKADVGALIAAGIEHSRYVSKAVILALDGVVRDGHISKGASEIIVPNAFVWQQTKQHANLLFGASINPYRDDALSELERVKKQGAVLIKWIPSIMHIDPADPELIPFYRQMVRFGLPLLTHTGKEHAFTHADDSLADSRRLELPLSLGVTVIAAHVASTGEQQGVRDFDLLLPMFARYPRLYADVSTLTQINKIGYMHEVLAHPEIHSHLIYGSDWPLSVFPLASPWYFADMLDVASMWSISRIANTWDADIRLKQALGMPSAVFARTREVLGLVYSAKGSSSLWHH